MFSEFGRSGSGNCWTWHGRPIRGGLRSRISSEINVNASSPTQSHPYHAIHIASANSMAGWSTGTALFGNEGAAKKDLRGLRHQMGRTGKRVRGACENRCDNSRLSSRHSFFGKPTMDMIKVLLSKRARSHCSVWQSASESQRTVKKRSEGQMEC